MCGKLMYALWNTLQVHPSNPETKHEIVYVLLDTSNYFKTAMWLLICSCLVRCVRIRNYASKRLMSGMRANSIGNSLCCKIQVGGLAPRHLLLIHAAVAYTPTVTSSQGGASQQVNWFMCGFGYQLAVGGSHQSTGVSSWHLCPGQQWEIACEMK